MAKILSECPKCHKKNISEKSHFILKNTKFINLSCGHTYREELKVTTIDSITLKDGKQLYPFQVEGVHFAEKSNFNCLIADEQGLGKTIQAVGLIHLHFDELKPILVIVKASLTIQWQRHIISETGRIAQIVGTKDIFIPGLGIYIVTYDTVSKLEDKIKKLEPKTIILDECQMIKNHEAKRTNGIRAIVNSKILKRESEKPIDISPRVKMIAKDLFNYHGISNRFNFLIKALPSNCLGLTRCKVKGEGIIVGDIILSKKLVDSNNENEILETILHEIAHAITPGAGHRQIWIDTAKSIYASGDIYAYSWCNGTINIDDDTHEKMIKNRIFLSGTPIKNNAIEYWPSLNLLNPSLFHSRADWLRWDVGYYLTPKGTWKAGGLRYPEQFKEKTKDFIIRRERSEVFPELPEITRDFRYHEITADEMKAYSLGIKKLEKFLESADKKSFNFTSQLQGHIMILRHITGLAKIAPVMEFVDEFAENGNETNWKLAIFHHHIDVGDILEKHTKDRGINFERIVAANDASKRVAKLDKFKNDDECHILMLPSLAAAEGFDLDFCETGILLEREWNPANEEQIEGRFIRATREMLERARNGNAKATLVYPTAVNTIDEFFAELVERKRQYVKETLRGESSKVQWNESQIMLELAEIAIQRAKNI